MPHLATRQSLLKKILGIDEYRDDQLTKAF